jgi:trans-aconitate methyltransferase
MKSLLRRSKRLRSARALLAACHEALRASPGKIAASFEIDYSSEDPWHYTTNPAERQRYAAARELLDAAEISGVTTGLEIGCGEGFFTEQLAPRCGRLLAVDLSSVALKRAAARCVSHPNVTFRRWDLLNGAALGTFDLVVCMDVLQCIPRPRARRRVVQKVAESVAAGGALLVSGVRRPEHVEDAWWGRWLPAGARPDAAQFGAVSPELGLVETRTTQLHLVSLFRAP